MEASVTELPLVLGMKRKVAQIGLDYIAVGFFSLIFAVLLAVYGGGLRVADGSVIWPFVVLVNQMASYLVGGGQEQLNYYSGQTAVVPLDEQSRQQTYVLSAPDATKFSLPADL